LGNKQPKLLLALAVVLVWHKLIQPQFGEILVLALTAAVILWYTVETMRLRREAEDRAKRDREPRIYFEVGEPTRIPTASGDQHHSGFVFQNDSSNAAFARVRVRLSIDGGPSILTSNPGYDGKQIWEVFPLLRIQGHFNLEDFSGFRPSGDMQLTVQVDVYGLDRKYLATLKREYRIRMPETGFRELWPEVATSLPVLPYSDVC
jgi:hypothetical protein